MKKKFLLFLSFALICTLVGSVSAVSVALEAPLNLFDVENLSFIESYYDDFDGKTQEDIYAEWNGVVKAARPQPITEDGWLKADWDTSTGVGYSFKQSFRDARYDFDLKYEKTGSTSHATVVFRSNTNAGNFYGGMQPGSTSGNVNGVGFHYYNSSAEEGKMTISVADSAGEVMSNISQFHISYPTGIDFTQKTHVTVYDLDDRILFFLENKPFAAVIFENLVGDTYTSGSVYQSDGAVLGTFEKKVRRETCFAITSRYTAVYLDNFTVGQENTGALLYDVSGLDFLQIYSDGFDGKSGEEIYSVWDGVYKAGNPAPVTEDGWLMADNLNAGTTGLGYAYKTAYANAKYEFDLKSGVPDTSDYHSGIVFRTAPGANGVTSAGGMYGGIKPTSPSSVSGGIGFYFYSTVKPGYVTILVAGKEDSVMSEAARFELPYPEGVDFTQPVSMTVYDLDDRLLFFVQDQPFAAIAFGGLQEQSGVYTSGTVYSGAGAKLGGFSKAVVRNSCFTVLNRSAGTTAGGVYLDNFILSKLPSSITEIEEISTSVVNGTSYAEALKKLPDRVWTVLSGGDEGYLNVLWEESSAIYNGSAQGVYEISGRLTSDTFLLSEDCTVTAHVKVLEPIAPIEEGKNVLYQYMPVVGQLHMGYIIRTKTGKLIVIDGGWVTEENQDQEGLFRELCRISGSDHPVVDAWILTHCHADHISEFIRIGYENYNDITVKNIYLNFPSAEQAYSLERIDELYQRFVTAYDRLLGEGAFASHRQAQRGDVIVVDDVVIDILQVMNGSETNINDTSMVFRVNMDGQSILFLGDLAAKSGERLYADWGTKLKSDVVQMAHHGQQGVNENVYQMVDPSICLWPTPVWLWDCEEGGSYLTWQTKIWMSRLNVKQHIVAGLTGTSALEFPLNLDTYAPNVITGVNYNSIIYVPKGGERPVLPSTVTVVDNLLQVRELEVAWVGEVDLNAVGEYLLEGRLLLDETLENPAQLKASLKVVVYDEAKTFLADFENGLADFDAYFIEDPGVNMQGIPRDVSENWVVEDNKLVRVNDLAGNSGDTTNIAVLTYAQKTFKNFILSVDVTMGTDSFWWPTVAILQKENNGSYFLADGLGVFIQQAGVATVWGSGTNGPIEGKAISGYKSSVPHNMTVIVLGKSLKFYVDNSLALDITLSQDLGEGYISLMSVNNASTFANLVIQEITESDISSLTDLIERAESFAVSDWINGWVEFQDALEQAKRVSVYDEQSLIDAACQQLEAAIAALVPVGDATELAQFVSECSVLAKDDYTGASYKVFQASLDAAAALTRNPAAQEALDAALTALTAAKNALVRVEKAALDALISGCEQLERKHYTETSWANLEQALEEAKVLSALEQADRQQLEDAAQKLNEALAGLQVSDSCSSSKSATLALAALLLLAAFAIKKRI